MLDLKDYPDSYVARLYDMWFHDIDEKMSKADQARAKKEIKRQAKQVADAQSAEEEKLQKMMADIDELKSTVASLTTKKASG